MVELSRGREQPREQRWHRETTPSPVEAKGSCCSHGGQTDDGHHLPHPASLRAAGGRLADALRQHRGGPARGTAPAAAPWNPRADRPRDARPAIPDGADPPGGERGSAHRDPGGGSGGVSDLPAHAAATGHRAREGARHAGADLFQERERLAGRLAQAEHGHRPGLLQPRRGRHPPRHRDGRRPVGERPRIRRQPLRPGDEGLHGPDQLRAEAVSAQLHRVVRRDGHPLAVERDERRARRSSPRTPTRPAAWASRSAKRSRRPAAGRTRSTRSAASSTMCCCTRR